MSVRDTAADWVQALCSRAAVQQEFLQRVDHALEGGMGCSFVVGRDLTKNGKPYLLYLFSGQFFTFVLTPDQSAQLKVTDNMLSPQEGPRQHDHGPSPKPLILLGDVTVDHAAALDRSTPITGTLPYRVDQWITDPLAIRIMCDPSRRANLTLYHHLFALPPPAGTIQFSARRLGDLQDRTGTPFTGVTPLFFQIWTTAVTEPTTPSPSPVAGYASVAKPGYPHPGVAPAGQPFAAPTPWKPNPFPPAAYNPLAPDAPPPPKQERPVSDIRAVIVNVGEPDL